MAIKIDEEEVYVAYVVSLLIVFYVFMSIQVNSSYQHHGLSKAHKVVPST